MVPIESDVDPRLLLALGHPARQRIMIRLSDTPASTATLAAELELELVSARRHLAVLRANDAVEPVDEEGEPDAIRFRAMTRPFLDDAHWRELPPHRRAALFAMTLRRIFSLVSRGFAHGEFGHERTHVSSVRLHLDEQGWQELADLLAGVLEEAMQIEAESAERLGQAPDAAQYESKLAILHFGRE